MLKCVETTGFTHCITIIQAAMKIDADWIDKAKEKMSFENHNTVKITKDDVKTK